MLHVAVYAYSFFHGGILSSEESDEVEDLLFGYPEEDAGMCLYICMYYFYIYM